MYVCMRGPIVYTLVDPDLCTHRGEVAVLWPFLAYCIVLEEVNGVIIHACMYVDSVVIV